MIPVNRNPNDGFEPPMDLAALRRWWPLAAVLGLLFVTAIAATRSAPQLDQIVRDDAPPADPPLLPTAPPSVTSTTPPATPEAASSLPDWVGNVALLFLAALCLIALALVVVALLRDQRRRRSGRRGTRVARRDPTTADELV